MQDISARELKGHNILAVERFHDSTRWMIEFTVLTPDTPYGSPGDEVRLFLDDRGYEQALLIQNRPLVGLHGIEKIHSPLVRDHLLNLNLQLLRRRGLLLRLLLGDHRDLVLVTDDGLAGGKDVAPRQRDPADGKGGDG